MKLARRKIGDILKLEYGKPLPKGKRKSTGLYPVYGANGEKTRSDDFFFNKKSIIVGRKGSAGEINLTEEKFWPLDVTYFVTFDEKEYDLKFLYYLLTTLELPSLAKGIKPGVNRNDVYDIDVEVPSLAGQKKIAKMLDIVFTDIQSIKKNTDRKIMELKQLEVSILRKAISSGA